MQVTCSGAQDPIRLFFNLLVAGFVVIIIESDMAVFWLTALSSANTKFFSMLLDRTFVMHHVIKVLGYSVGVLFFNNIIPNPIKLIQYLLGKLVLLFTSQM